MAFLKLILTRFWPIFLPLAIYVTWLFYVNRKRQKHEKIKFGQGPFNYVIFSMIAILLCGMAYFAFEIQKQDKKYVPVHYENDKLVPGKVEE